MHIDEVFYLISEIQLMRQDGKLPVSCLAVTSRCTVPLDLNFTYARVQKATARNIHCNAPEYPALAPE